MFMLSVPLYNLVPGTLQAFGPPVFDKMLIFVLVFVRKIPHIYLCLCAVFMDYKYLQILLGILCTVF